MTKPRTTPSSFIRSTSVYLGPLQWAITDYYQDTAQKNLSDIIRGILALFAENDANFDPQHFWNVGVMGAYNRFEGDERLQGQVILESLRWLKRVYKWEPTPDMLPKIDAESQARARVMGVQGSEN